MLEIGSTFIFCSSFIHPVKFDRSLNTFCNSYFIVFYFNSLNVAYTNWLWCSDMFVLFKNLYASMPSGSPMYYNVVIYCHGRWALKIFQKFHMLCRLSNLCVLIKYRWSKAFIKFSTPSSTSKVSELSSIVWTPSPLLYENKICQKWL